MPIDHAAACVTDLERSKADIEAVCHKPS